MKKIFNSVLALSLLAVPLSTPVFAADNGSAISVTIDGKTLTSDQPPVIENGRTLVPLRSIFEALGAQVQWNQESKKITATKDATTINLTIGSKVGMKNNSVITLDQEPVILNGRTLVPIRFVSESLGEEVVWNESAQAVTITSSNIESSPSHAVQSNTNSQENEGADNSTTNQSTSSGFTSSANAVTSTTSPNVVNQDVSQLTYQQALDMANASSYTLRSAQADIEKSKYTLDKAGDNINTGFKPSTGGNTGATSAFTQYTQAQLSQQAAYKNIQKLQDQIAYQVKAAYNAVVLASDNKKTQDAAVENFQVQYQVAYALHQNGMNTDADLLKAKNAVDAAKAAQQQYEKAISDSYQSLNNLIGLKPDARPTLTEFPTMKKLDSSVDVDAKVSQAISQSPTLWSDQQQITQSKLAVNLFTFNNHSSTDTYEGKQIDVTKAQNQVQIDTDSLDKSVRSTYYSIKQAEDQYDSLLTQMSTDQATFNTVQAQFNAGMATKAQLVAAQYALAKDKNAQLNLTISQDNNLMILDKPWVTGK